MYCNVLADDLCCEVNLNITEKIPATSDDHHPNLTNTMDCNVPVDDLCYAREIKLGITEKNPTSSSEDDEFYIAVHVDMLVPFPEEDGEGFDYFLGDGLRGQTVFSKFWRPCPRLERNNLSRETISSMLSEAGVPLHKQEHMVAIISAMADEMANAPHNEDNKVLRMLVEISLFACHCCADHMDDSEISVVIGVI